MGFVAFSLIMPAELALPVFLFGQTVSELSRPTPISSDPSVAAQLLFAIIPYVQSEPRWRPPRL
jgi:hypothetical protein